jgi:hypothetical protein
MRFCLWSVLLVLLPSLIHSGHSINTSNIFSLGSILLKNFIVSNILQQVAMRFWLWSVLLVLLPSLIHSCHSISTNHIFSLGNIIFKKCQCF